MRVVWYRLNVFVYDCRIGFPKELKFFHADFITYEYLRVHGMAAATFKIPAVLKNMSLMLRL